MGRSKWPVHGGDLGVSAKKAHRARNLAHLKAGEWEISLETGVVRPERQNMTRSQQIHPLKPKHLNFSFGQWFSLGSFKQRGKG